MSLSDFLRLGNAQRMASPAQLTQTVSMVTGVPHATVVDIDRKLVKAGLRAKGGRGFNAAQMTSLDAARLLTAIVTSPQANDSAASVERYAATRPDKTISSAGLFGATELDDLATLPVEHSFVDAIAAVIESLATGQLSKMLLESRDDWAPHIEVFAFTRATKGRVRLSGLANGLTASVEYLSLPHSPLWGRARNVRSGCVNPGDDSLGDLEQSRRVTERTILPIAKLLAETGRDE
jgi:hypothetical protein